jgi:hypothetical protein
MRLEEAVSTYLQQFLSYKLYPLILPQNCILPAVVYTPVSKEITPALQIDTNFTKQTIQFSCYAKTYSEGVKLLEVIRDKLQNYAGLMADIKIGSVLILSENAAYEPVTAVYSVYIDFEFQFNEGGNT